MPKLKHSPEFRAKVSQEYLDGVGSVNDIIAKYGISRAAYYKWLHREAPDDELENIKLSEKTDFLFRSGIPVNTTGSAPGNSGCRYKKKWCA